jgi:hypothetical protein
MPEIWKIVFGQDPKRILRELSPNRLLTAYWPNICIAYTQQDCLPFLF